MILLKRLETRAKEMPEITEFEEAADMIMALQFKLRTIANFYSLESEKISELVDPVDLHETEK